MRRVLDAELRNGSLRSMLQRLGRAWPSKLEFCPGHDQRTATARPREPRYHHPPSARAPLPRITQLFLPAAYSALTCEDVACLHHEVAKWHLYEFDEPRGDSERRQQSRLHRELAIASTHPATAAASRVGPSDTNCDLPTAGPRAAGSARPPRGNAYKGRLSDS